MNKDQVNVFELLAEPVQKALIEIGLSKPTAPQIRAIPPVLHGENALLIAPTGSGKTEAVLLPVFSRFLQQEDKRGITILISLHFVHSTETWSNAFLFGRNNWGF